MRKSFFTICLALIGALTINAESFSGNIVLVRNGQTYNSDVTVTVTAQDNGLNTMELQVPLFGTMRMNDVPAANADGITVYSAVRDVATNFGTMRTTLFARTVNGMMAADVAIPAQNTTMWFNTVGNHFQLPNSDMEAWTASNGEPDRWHGFKTAGGAYASTSAGLVKLEQSNDVRSGATGHSAVMTANSAFGIVANGTMTNGRLMAGSMFATDTKNHAEMDKANGTDDFYMPLYAKPDKFNVWLKYTQGTTNANNKANVSVKTFDGSYYQEPDPDVTYTNLSGGTVGGQDVAPCDWTLFSFPFDYDSYAANGAETKAIFVDFATNVTPGTGSANDSLYVDDMELVYLGAMTDLRYQGQTIAGWNPAVTTYSIEVAGAPSLDDFTATIEGVSAVLTKSMEQNADGSYRIAISVVSADLQNASCYVINATVPTVKKGDVNNDGEVSISDVTTLIDYLLSGNIEDINPQAADVDGNNDISISDVTALIDMLLGSN